METPRARSAILPGRLQERQDPAAVQGLLLAGDDAFRLARSAVSAGGNSGGPRFDFEFFSRPWPIGEDLSQPRPCFAEDRALLFTLGSTAKPGFSCSCLLTSSASLFAGVAAHSPWRPHSVLFPYLDGDPGAESGCVTRIPDRSVQVELLPRSQQRPSVLQKGQRREGGDDQGT